VVVSAAGSADSLSDALVLVLGLGSDDGLIVGNKPDAFPAPLV
jgi:hypothetical protein